ncbi:hypothetical protein FACS189492_1160 [Clostridia bacterium]|nr:hypothetical protein FACS189492_1160 [Clostridia bacterium]
MMKKFEKSLRAAAAILVAISLYTSSALAANPVVINPGFEADALNTNILVGYPVYTSAGARLENLDNKGGQTITVTVPVKRAVAAAPQTIVALYSAQGDELLQVESNIIAVGTDTHYNFNYDGITTAPNGALNNNNALATPAPTGTAAVNMTLPASLPAGSYLRTFVWDGAAANDATPFVKSFRFPEIVPAITDAGWHLSGDWYISSASPHTNADNRTKDLSLSYLTVNPRGTATTGEAWQVISVNPNTEYKINFRARRNASANFYCKLTSEDGLTNLWGPNPINLSSADIWAKCSFLYKTSDTETKIRLVFTPANHPTNTVDNAAIDNVSIEEYSNPNFFDTRAVANGKFANSGAGWTFTGTGFETGSYLTGSNHTVYTFPLRLTPKNGLSTASQIITVTPNTDYILSFLARRDNATNGKAAGEVLTGTSFADSLSYVDIGNAGEAARRRLCFNSGSNTQIKFVLKNLDAETTNTTVSWYDDVKLYQVTNLLTNADFETATASKANNWILRSQGDGATSFTSPVAPDVDTVVKRFGNQSVKVTPTDPYTQTITQTFSPNLVSTTHAERGGYYFMSAWLKAKAQQNVATQYDYTLATYMFNSSWGSVRNYRVLYTGANSVNNVYRLSIPAGETIDWFQFTGTAGEYYTYLASQAQLANLAFVLYVNTIPVVGPPESLNIDGVLMCKVPDGFVDSKDF